jgi:hypothetical protein
MSKATRTTAQEAWKQQSYAGGGGHDRAPSIGDRQPIDWSNARLVAPMCACARCHAPRTVYAEGDRCVECRSVKIVY